MNTRKLTISAVSAAISAVMIILTNFLPLRFSLLFVCTACYYLAFKRCGLVYGFLTILASILISFFTSPLSSAFFLIIIIFAPYSVIAFFVKNLKYTVAKQLMIRVAIVAVFSVLSFFLAYFSAEFIDFKILELVGNYGFVALIIFYTIFFIVFDFIFNQLMFILEKNIIKI